MRPKRSPNPAISADEVMANDDDITDRISGHFWK